MAREVKPIVTAIAPGPLSIGIASGENDTSRLARAACRAGSSAVASLGAAISMVEPIPATSMPPAIRSPGIEMPKKPMIKVPPMRKLTRITTM